jgi:hypothetical protein
MLRKAVGRFVAVVIQMAKVVCKCTIRIQGNFGVTYVPELQREHFSNGMVDFKPGTAELGIKDVFLKLELGVIPPAAFLMVFSANHCQPFSLVVQVINISVVGKLFDVPSYPL